MAIAVFSTSTPAVARLWIVDWGNLLLWPLMAVVIVVHSIVESSPVPVWWVLLVSPPFLVRTTTLTMRASDRSLIECRSWCGPLPWRRRVTPVNQISAEGDRLFFSTDHLQYLHSRNDHYLDVEAAPRIAAILERLRGRLAPPTARVVTERQHG